MKKILFSLLVAFSLFSAPVSAQTNGLDPEVQKAQDYLQSLSTAQARFVQTAPDGTQEAGEFYLHRPGKLRFQFDPPVKDFVVADGLFIYFYDGQLKQQSNAPIGQTLADFLLRRDLKLSGDVTVTEVRHSSGGLLLVSLVQTSDRAGGTLTLAFSEKPFQLVKWRVTDATGTITEVALSDFKANIKLDDKLFYYHPPKDAGGYQTNQ